jgi:hypothetical protein
MSELTADQVAYCRECAAARREIWRHHEVRLASLEEAAVALAAWYPDNVSTNAFCAAIRSLKTTPYTPS